MKPQWMNEEVWKGLCNYWDTLEFKARAERNKINRASDCGGLGSSLHTGGSIPFTEVRRRLVSLGSTLFKLLMTYFHIVFSF